MRASSWASTTTRRARSVNLSNMGAPSGATEAMTVAQWLSTLTALNAPRPQKLPLFAIGVKDRIAPPS
ncbi:hypothetical protein GCM10010407_09940 [Rarobacter incanus]